MKHNSSRFTAAKAAALAAMAFAFAMATPASAQGPNTWTPAGTEIKNQATATYTDANGNDYDEVESNEVTVIVGKRASVGVAANGSPIEFDHDTDDNVVTWTVTNFGNFTDRFSFGFSNDNGTAFTNVRICADVPGPGETCYATLALFNTAMSTFDFDTDDALVVTAKFNIPAGQGGEDATFNLEATSLFDGAIDDNDDFEVSVILESDDGDPANGVSVVAGGPVQVIPTNFNGTTRLYYDATFTVTSNLTGTDVFDLVSTFSTSDADITIIRLTLCSDKATAITTVSLASLGSANICVLYNVAATAVATDAASINLDAEAQSDALVTDNDDFDITVILAAITLAKTAHLDNAGAFGAEITTEEPIPGDFMWYQIEVSNDGGADAASIAVEDQLPAQVTYISQTDDAGAPAWAFVGSVTGTGLIKAQIPSLAASATRWIRIRVQIK